MHSHTTFCQERLLLIATFALIASLDLASAIACTAGTYASIATATHCTSCETGKYSTTVGGSASSVCVLCGTGKFSTAVGSTTCLGSCSFSLTECGKDLSASDGFYNCERCTCAAGAYYIKDYDGKYYSEYCALCSRGLHSSINGASTCKSCEAGKYSSETGAIVCTSCEIGKYLSLTGGSSVSNCLLCETGTYSSVIGTSTCTLCSEVTYITMSGSTECTSCAPGTYSTAIKRTGCTNTFTWSASNYPGITPAASATATQGVRSNSTSWFLPGNLNGIGIQWSSPWSCCTPTSANGVWYLISGVRNPASGQTYLQSIWASTSVSYITFTSGISNEFYFPKISRNIGFISFELECGGISCSGDPAAANVNFGVDLNNNGNIDFGTAGAIEIGCGMSIGATSGRVHAANGTQTQYTRTLSTNTRWFGFRLILDIQAGTMRIDSKSLYFVSATSPVNNPQWMPQISGINANFNWSALDAQNPALWNGVMFTSCKESVKVPWFTFTSYPTIGTIFNQTSLNLEVCPAGTYWINSSQCLQCPVGLYSSATAMSACSNCTPGTYSTSEGAVGCTNCLAGTYAETAASSVCSNCPIGTYSPTAAASACFSCPSGKYTSAASASMCSTLTCQAGTYLSASTAVECSICQAGTYSSDTSANMCLDCKEGTYTPEIGASVCTTCPACSLNGYYTAGCSGTAPGSCEKCVNTVI